MQYYEWNKAARADLVRDCVVTVLHGLPPRLALPLGINTTDIQADINERNIGLMRRCYDHLCSLQLNYGENPFTRDGHLKQDIRTLKIIDRENKGTCIDLALLFCSLCMAYNLVPILIVLADHAFVAVGKNDRRGERNDIRNHLSQIFDEEGQLVDYKRSLRALGAYYQFIECTGFVKSDVKLKGKGWPEARRSDGKDLLTFDEAMHAGEKQVELAFTEERSFWFALDVAGLLDEKKLDPRLSLETDTWRNLLDQLFEIVRDPASTWTHSMALNAHRASAPQYWRPLHLRDGAPSASIWAALEDLSDAEPRLPLLEAVERLSRVPALPVSISRKLRRWNVTAAAEAGMSLVEVNRRIAEQPIAPELTRPHLLLLLKPAAGIRHPRSRLFSVGAWLWTDQYQRPLVGDEQVYTTAEVETMLDRQLSELAAELGTAFSELVIAFFLPRILMDIDLSRWVINKQSPFFSKLVKKHPVVVRSLERTYGDGYKQNHAAWRRKWQEVLKEPGVVDWLNDNRIDPESNSLGAVKRLGLACVPKRPQYPRDAKRDALAFALWMGTPIAAWPHVDLYSQETLREKLDPLLCNAGDRLPHLLLEKRQQSSTDGFWSNITILWDDPTLTPPDTVLRWEAPK
jgi:vWA-MoxR associated protein C-terminal domain